MNYYKNYLNHVFTIFSTNPGICDLGITSSFENYKSIYCVSFKLNKLTIFSMIDTNSSLHFHAKFQKYCRFRFKAICHSCHSLSQPIQGFLLVCFGNKLKVYCGDIWNKKSRTFIIINDVILVDMVNLLESTNMT